MDKTVLRFARKTVCAYKGRDLHMHFVFCYTEKRMGIHSSPSGMFFTLKEHICMSMLEESLAMNGCTIIQ